jgi:hypothetical protein
LATSFAFCFNSGSSSILVVHQLEALDHVRNRKRCLILPMMKQRLPRRSRTRPEVDMSISPIILNPAVQQVAIQESAAADRI